jgi:hypothetical protein
MFLILATILFAALAAASTEQLKTLLSTMGLLTSAIWLLRMSLWTDLSLKSDSWRALALPQFSRLAGFSPASSMRACGGDNL